MQPRKRDRHLHVFNAPLYSTVGIITLKHPRITNRPVFAERLTLELQATLDEWKENKPEDRNLEDFDFDDVLIPLFQVQGRSPGIPTPDLLLGKHHTNGN